VYAEAEFDQAGDLVGLGLGAQAGVALEKPLGGMVVVMAVDDPVPVTSFSGLWLTGLGCFMQPVQAGGVCT
jgi:hypothetical protein